MLKHTIAKDFYPIHKTELVEIVESFLGPDVDVDRISKIVIRPDGITVTRLELPND